MQQVGTAGQFERHHLYDASGTIASGSSPQLIVHEVKSRQMFYFANNSAATMYLDIGSARAKATITNGVVTSIAVLNGGFGFTYPPIINLIGGGNITQNTRSLGGSTPDIPSPQNIALAHCVISGGAVTSIVVDSGGSGYLSAPYCLIENSINDPYGCASPSATGAGSIPVSAGGSYPSNGVGCTTDAIAVFCATPGAAYTFKYMI